MKTTTYKKQWYESGHPISLIKIIRTLIKIIRTVIVSFSIEFNCSKYIS